METFYFLCEWGAGEIVGHKAAKEFMRAFRECVEG
jgi:hypothetical protein